MKLWRLMGPCLLTTSLVIGIASLGVPTARAHAVLQARNHHIRAKISWQEHDRAVYVVSTLNAPLCGSGQQLSTVLWNHEDARLFSVLRSTAFQGLYYIQVRTDTRKLVGVYAYRFGWKLPKGVLHGRCVGPSPNGAFVSGYHARNWKFITLFHTTFPQG